MAVWLFAYGHNALGNYQATLVPKYVELINSVSFDALTLVDSIEPVVDSDSAVNLARLRTVLAQGIMAHSDEQHRAYLEFLKYPEMSREQLLDEQVDSYIRDRFAERESYLQLRLKLLTGMTQAWTPGRITETEAYFENSTLDFDHHTSALKVLIYNDVIWLSGPFAVFSNYGSFQKGITAAMKAAYHQLFSGILSAFGSEFIFYAHEWSYIEDDERALTSAQLVEDILSVRSTCSESLDTMENFYFERL